MTDLVVRRLLIDLASPIAVRWNGGDAFSSALFNALSMSFPVGEQYFIDSVRAGLAALPEAERAPMADEVRAFVGQEATHRRLHALFNQHLERQGLRNTVEPRARRRVQAGAHHDVRVHVAATAATEHFTAVFADWLMRHPDTLAGAEPRLRTLWLWHAAEESEHRSTAFDLYQKLSGHHGWRVRLYRWVTVIFLADLTRQTLRNLWHDGAWWRWGTWRSGAALLFSRDGLLRGNVGPWRDYLASDFHPLQHDHRLSSQWLREHAQAYVPVGGSAA